MQSLRDDVVGLKRDFTFINTEVHSLAENLRNYAETTAKNFERLSNELSQSGKTNWTLVGSFLGLAFSLVIGFWFIVQLSFSQQTATQINPLQAKLVAAEEGQKKHDQGISDLARLTNDTDRSLQGALQRQQANTAVIANLREQTEAHGQAIAASSRADEQSRTDRAQLNDRVRKTEEEVAADQTVFQSQIAELNANQREIETQFKSLSNITNLELAHIQQWIAQLWEASHPGQRFPESTFYPEMYNPSPPTVDGGPVLRRR